MVAAGARENRALLRLLQLLGHLPLPALHALARIGSFIIYRLLGYRRQVVRDNLRRAFPQRNAKELTVLQKTFYRHLTEVAVEILRARCMPVSELQCRIHTSNAELLLAASDNNSRPLLILTLHQGNWEWMLHSTAAFIDMPLVPVYKPLHNPTIDALMREIRGRFGARPLALGDLTHSVLRHRRQPRCLLMVADQSPLSSERTYWAEFLGQPTAFHLGPAALARATGATVVFARCRRQAPGYYQVDYELLAEPREALQPDDIAQRYVRAAEDAIRAQPSSWLWSNRRWKRTPPAAIT